MPKTPRKPAPLVGKIFLGSTAPRRRLLTAAELRSAAWRPLHVTARRLRDDLDGFLAELRAALRLRARQR